MLRVAVVMLLLAGCVPPLELCRDTCDGCCKGAICVPLAQTNRTQCGREGAQCIDGETGYCPVCSQGVCSTGTECFIRRPERCDCGAEGDAVCGYDCGACPTGLTCSNHRCVSPGADAGP